MAQVLHCTTCMCELAVGKKHGVILEVSLAGMLPQLQEIDIPVPGDGQALIKMTSR